MAINGRDSSWLTKAVADELRALVRRDGVTQQRIAAHLGRSQAYVSERLRGETPIDLDDLDGIAELLGTNGLDLLLDVVRRGQIGDVAARVSEQRKGPGPEVLGGQATDDPA